MRVGFLTGTHRRRSSEEAHSLQERRTFDLLKRSFDFISCKLNT
jgi:hypothetical protein